MTISVDDFMDELSALCKKYGVGMFGAGDGIFQRIIVAPTRKTVEDAGAIFEESWTDWESQCDGEVYPEDYGWSFYGVK